LVENAGSQIFGEQPLRTEPSGSTAKATTTARKNLQGSKMENASSLEKSDLKSYLQVLSISHHLATFEAKLNKVARHL
jgi:hypothetical protein